MRFWKNAPHYRYENDIHYYLKDNVDYYYYSNGKWVLVKASNADSEARTTSETASTADSTLTLLRELLGHVTIYYN